MVCDIPAPYLSPDAREERLAALALAAGGEMIRYGESVLGRPLWVVRFPSTVSGAPGTAPRLLCTANIHGPEYIAALVALGLLQELGHAGSAAHGLRSGAEVWVAPCLNPDGYAETFARGGRGPLVTLRPNAHGVDLNRNFPLPAGARPTWIPGAGSRTPGKATYRGAAPLSEPETVALDRLLGEARFVASVNLHSFMGTVIPARVTDRPSYRVYRRLAHIFRAAQPRHRYRRLAHRVLDVFTGELEDHQHHHHDCWAICVESMTVWHSLRQHLCAPTTFARFNPRAPEDWVQNDLPGVVAFLEAVRELPRPSQLAERSIVDRPIKG